jgi:hypothetical protein
VGLVWAGDPKHPRDRQRSISPSLLSPLFGIPAVRIFSLQKGPAAGAVRDLRLTDAMTELGPQLYEYADTAAVVDNLDLVVTVDTSVAHLAGALGKRVWLLLPFSADWRWMENRLDSPWYPTMRLFRQTRPDDWSDVIESVRAAMVELSDGLDTRSSNDAPEEGRPQMRVPGVALPRAAPAVAPGLSRACRSRFGMMQFVPGSDSLARSIEYYGDYLQTQLEIAKHLVAHGDIVVELGAGIGFHSIGLARIVGPDGQLLAIESSELLRRILRQNVSINEPKGVSVMPAALAGASLDELDLERVDMVKVTHPKDVAKVLDGGKNTLQRHRPILLFTHQPRAGLYALGQQISCASYSCWSVDTPLFDRANFNRRSDDLFGGERSYAVLALPRDNDVSPLLRAMPEIKPIAV